MCYFKHDLYYLLEDWSSSSRNFSRNTFLISLYNFGATLTENTASNNSPVA
jgi:hypothetical protein